MLGDPAGMILKILAPAAIVAAGVGSFLLFGQKPEPSAPPADARRGVLVETVAVKAFDGAFRLHLDGIALPVRQIKLAAEVEGRITAKTVQARGGRSVEPGTPLLEIDATDYELSVERLQAQARQSAEELAAVDVEIASTEALLTLAVEDQALARRALDRTVDLSVRNAISETELDEAKRQELTSRNALQTLRNQLSMLQQKRRTQLAATELVAVQLRQAQADLARTKIVSPITGSVIVDRVEIDDHVRPGDVLIELSDNSQMEIRCSLTIDQLYWIWLSGGAIAAQRSNAAFEAGDAGSQQRPEGSLRLPDLSSKSLLPSSTASLELPRLPVYVVYEFAGQTVEWDGVLSRYEGSGLDAQTRTAPCRILVSQPTQARVRSRSDGSGAASVAPPRMFAGMYVDIEVPIVTQVPLLKLPLEAIRPGESVRSGRKTWVVRDGTLAIVDISVARVERDHALIHARQSGLRAGDRVVVSPLASVSDGLAVREATGDPFDGDAAKSPPELQAGPDKEVGEKSARNAGARVNASAEGDRP